MLFYPIKFATNYSTTIIFLFNSFVHTIYRSVFNYIALMDRSGTVLSLGAGSVLLLKGRATARCDGRVSVLGMDVDGRDICVRRGKTLPLEVHGPATISLRMEEDGWYTIADEQSRVGTGIWKGVIDTIRDSRPKRVMLVGATDTGKSTLATYISNVAVADGLGVGMVDSDIGQGDIAPPACIGSCMVREQVLDLRDLEADEYYFIGRLTPVGAEDHLIVGVTYLINNLKSADMVIVNTDGYVGEPGLRYKARMAEYIGADLVVVLGESDGSMMDALRARVVHVDAPSNIQKRRDERVARRIEQYRRFLAGGRKVRFRAGSREFVLACGKRVRFTRNGIMVDDGVIMSYGMLAGMFVALAVGDRVMGFAMLDEVEGSGVTMVTNYEGEFDRVILSSIRLARDVSVEHRLDLI